MLDRSPVPESAKRLSSDEIRALFEKVKTGTVAPEQEVTTPAPVVAGKKWTPEKVAELKAYREKYGTAKTAVHFKITTGYIRQLLPTGKPKPKGYSAFKHLIKDA
jgi:hypothetical protein